MIRDSQGWNLQEQYLLICVFVIVCYRVVSFLTVYFSLPRYSYSKTVKGSAQNDIDILDEQNGNAMNGDGGNATSTQQNQNGHRNSISMQRRASTDIITETQSRSCLSYCWLQLLFDFGYIMELAPWLWNWEQTKIILPEFAWFSKV